jgi:hypothetical protein
MDDLANIRTVGSSHFGFDFDLYVPYYLYPVFFSYVAQRLSDYPK